MKGKTGMTPLTPSSVPLFLLSANPPPISQASPTIRQRVQLTPSGLWASYALFSIDAPLRSSSPPCNTPHIESEPISLFLIHMGLLRRHWHSSSPWESGPPFELSSMRMRSIVGLQRMTSDGLIHHGCHGPHYRTNENSMHIRVIHCTFTLEPTGLKMFSSSTCCFWSFEFDETCHQIWYLNDTKMD